MVVFLNDGDAHWRGVYMGASNELDIHWDQLTGLTSVPVIGASSAPPERLRDTAMPGWADVGWRSIQALGLRVNGDEALNALVTAMMDRHTVSELTFADRSIHNDNLSVFCVADRCEDPRNASTFTNRDYLSDLQWLASDPTIYSATTTTRAGESPASSHSLVFTNNGRWASPSGRAWTLTITASGTVKDPYVQSTTSDQIVTWQGLTLTNGQVLSLDEYRVSRIGSQRQDSYPRSGTSLAPDWPIHQPGSNTFVVGCSSGSITCELTVRDTF